MPSCRESRTGTGSVAGYGHGTAPQAGGKRAQRPRGSLAPYTTSWPEGPGRREEAAEGACLAAGPHTCCLLCAARSCLGWTRMGFRIGCFLFFSINQDKTFCLIFYFPCYKQSKGFFIKNATFLPQKVECEQVGGEVPLVF